VTQRPSGVRQVRRDDVTSRILQIGRAHLATYGAAALSLRAVTRELGMVSSAVYRYVASRDELLTLLVVDAYSDLADAVDVPRAAVDVDEALEERQRLAVVGVDVRRHRPSRIGFAPLSDADRDADRQRHRARHDKEGDAARLGMHD